MTVDTDLPHGALLILRGRCACRDWPLLAGVKHGKCGYCTEYCTILGIWEESND